MPRIVTAAVSNRLNPSIGRMNANGTPDDGATRNYANGAGGTFIQALYDEAKKDRWFVISMKNDWKRVFAFEN